MQLFIIGDEAKQELALLKSNAESNPFNADAMRARLTNTYVPGDKPLFTCFIPIDYKVVYTIDTALNGNNETVGTCRHLSMSILSREQIPHPIVCQEVMNELGFVKRLDSGKLIVSIQQEYIIDIIEMI